MDSFNIDLILLDDNNNINDIDNDTIQIFNTSTTKPEYKAFSAPNCNGLPLNR